MSAKLLELTARLALPETRAAAADELAAELGAEAMLIFVRDAEIDAFLTAPGFPQTIPNGKLWRAFLSAAAEREQHRGTLPLRSADERLPAVAYTCGRDTVFVLLGTDSPSTDVEWFRALLPLFAAVFRGERTAGVAAAQTRLAQESAARSAMLAQTLDRTRHQLEDALEDAREARTAAETANRAKSEFLATMSHELRTPLNAIGGHVQLLEMGVRGPITDDQRDALGRIDRSQRHLLGLINDILNLSRIESGRVEYVLSNVSVSDALADLAPMIDPQLSAKSIAFEVRAREQFPAVRADREKLQQILLNLLSNAVKFTDAHGRVWIDATTRAGAPRKVFIRVSDTGSGIPEDKLEAIFEPFIQVDASHSRLGQGTGLGLAISRDLARGMGGDLRVRSELGAGSTFTLTLDEAAGETRAP